MSVMEIMAKDLSALIGASSAKADQIAALQADNTQRAINVKSAPYNAKGDGVTNDTTFIQNAINATPEGGTVYLPSGRFLCYSPLNITKQITIQGQAQQNTLLIFIGCDGLNITASNVQIRDIEISGDRYSITPNSLVGIKVNGTSAVHAQNINISDVYVDGFNIAFQASYIWSSVFYNFKTAFCHVGMQISGASVNNFVVSPSMVVDGSAGSKGIYFTGDVTTEGWSILGGLIYGGEVGIHGVAINHVRVKGVVIDFCVKNGIWIQDNGTSFASNWDIEGNYIAMSGSAGDAAIKSTNIASVSNPQIRGNHIRGNDLLVYGGAVCYHGIWFSGDLASDANAIIEGNTLKGFSLDDINVPSRCNNTIIGNTCLSAISPNIIGGDLVANNVGVVYYQRSLNYSKIGKMKITYDELVPTLGTWNAGDICYSIQPAVTGFVGWVCTVAGTPGTWKTFGAVTP